MNHAEAQTAALRGIRKVASFALHVSPSLVDMQCNGERPTAADRLERIVVTAREQGSPDADAPVFALLDSLGYLPPVRREFIDGEILPAELSELCRAMADMVDAKAATLDGETAEEADRYDRTLAHFGYLIQRERTEVAMRAALRNHQRIGPKRAPRHEATSRRATA